MSRCCSPVLRGNCELKTVSYDEGLGEYRNMTHFSSFFGFLFRKRPFCSQGSEYLWLGCSLRLRRRREDLTTTAHALLLPWWAILVRLWRRNAAWWSLSATAFLWSSVGPPITVPSDGLFTFSLAPCPSRRWLFYLSRLGILRLLGSIIVFQRPLLGLILG